MRRRFIGFAALSLVASLIFSFTVSAEAPAWIAPEEYDTIDEYAYSFAVVGDTQIITSRDEQNANKGNKTNYLETLYQWIIDNKEEKKIEYVMGLGDITDRDQLGEWKIAFKQISKLQGVVPYSLVRGNHDSVVQFVSAFGNYTPYTSTFEGYYDGEHKLLNNYRTLTVCGIKYLIMVLDYYPTNDELAWASSVAEAHPEHRIIVTTHSHIFADGNQVYIDDSVDAPSGNNGKKVWSKFLRNHENIFMVIAGHVAYDDITVNVRKGLKGNNVIQMLIDPQGMDSEDLTGLVAMLYFSEDGSKITLEWYSTIKKQYKSISTTEIEIEPYGTELLYTTSVSDTEAPVSETADNTAEATTNASTSSGGCSNTVELVALPAVFAGALGASLCGRKRDKKQKVE